MREPSARESAEFGRVRWHCRRGMKELDVLLSRYAEAHYLASSPADREAFRRLLDSQDALIYDYCLGIEVPPNPEVLGLIERITAGRGNDR
jgi:antitoxin CptB